MKKLLILIFLLNLQIGNAQSIEPDVFVQSTVNRASEILSKDISKKGVPGEPCVSARGKIRG